MKNLLFLQPVSHCIGISNSRLSHIITGRNNPSLDIIQNILLKYNEINPVWLLFGEDPMYIHEKAKVVPETKTEKKNDLKKEIEAIKTIEVVENTQPANKAINKDTQSRELPEQKKRNQLKLTGKRGRLILEEPSNHQQAGIKQVIVFYDNKKDTRIFYPLRIISGIKVKSLMKSIKLYPGGYLFRSLLIAFISSSI